MGMNKYRAVKTVVDGIRFDSKAEAQRYRDLSLLCFAGNIASLEWQVSFPLVVGDVTICSYVADFRYTSVPSGEIVVEDVKGVCTPVYRLKKKLVRALYGFEIQEWPPRVTRRKPPQRGAPRKQSEPSRPRAPQAVSEPCSPRAPFA